MPAFYRTTLRARNVNINKKNANDGAAGRFVQRWGTFLIAGVLLCGAWAYVFASLAEHRHQLLEDRQRELAQLNSAVALQSAGLLKVAETHLRTLDKFLQANPRTDPRTDPHFVALSDMLRTSSNGLVELRMVSVEGKLYHIGSPEGGATSTLRDKAYVKAQHSSSGKNLYIGDPVQSRATGAWGIPIYWCLARDRPAHRQAEAAGSGDFGGRGPVVSAPGRAADVALLRDIRRTRRQLAAGR